MFGRRKSSDDYVSPRRRAGSSSGRKRQAASASERGSLFTRRAAAKNVRNRPEPRKEAKSGFFSRSPARPGGGMDWGRVRLWTVGLCFTLLWAALWGRAYYLQIVKGPEYAAMAKRQHTATEQVRGVRGNILDRNGNVLARSVEAQSVWINPAQIEDKQGTALKLSKALGLPVGSVLSKVQEQRRFLWLKRKVDSRAAEALRELRLPGVYFDTEYRRVYPYKHLAGQLLGFVNIDDNGIEGLEKAFEAELAGRSVTQVVERDAAGRRLMAPGSGTIVDLRGRDARLTLDAQVQFFAEEALAEYVGKYGARWGGCIVVDVPTGDILAWAQFPFFDPNNAKATPEADRRNRLAMDALEQGSTIKSFLVAAALEEQVVKPSTVINCEKGQWKLRKVILHDTHSYDRLTVDKILHVSSNIGAAKIGLMLGAEKYRGYLSRLGFGQRTGLPLASEARGILRATNKWSEIDLATASFGQSFSATMIQVAQAYMCLASDGLKTPLRLLMDDSIACRIGTGVDAPPEPGAERVKLFSEGTMQQVRDMLREVVEEEGGTGKQARIPGLIVGGKTGTAQKADKSGKYGRGRVGSFVGMIPIENPRYLICVLLDEPTKVQYGGIIAAPVFRHVALNTMAYHGLLPDTDDPLVLAVAKKEADRKSSSKGGQNKKTKETAKEAPKPARAPSESPSGQETAAVSASTVPVVIGLGIRSAVEVFAQRGIVPEIKGKGGFVVRQVPEAGSAWPDAERKCVLWLEERAS